jgi:hypothetical protein
VLVCFTSCRSQTVDVAFTNCQRCPVPAELTGVIRLGEPAPVLCASCAGGGGDSPPPAAVSQPQNQETGKPSNRKTDMSLEDVEANLRALDTDGDGVLDA